MSTCSPSGDFRSPVRLDWPACGRCHVLLSPAWNEKRSQWYWIDVYGKTVVREPWADGLEERYLDVWKRMLDKKQTVSDADCQWYSTTKAALDLCWLQLWHEHSPVGGKTLGEPPWCCEWPMQSIGPGWRCREAGTVVSYSNK